MSRKMCGSLWLALSFILILAFDLRCQELTDLSALQRGDDVEVTYQLKGQSSRAFTVALFASHDNYASPLKMVEGDTGGKRILPGPNKKIIWKAKEELTNFDGDIAFEIRAILAPPLFTDITTLLSKVKRGKDMTIHWKGLFSDENVSVQLTRKEKRVIAGATPNQGRFVFAVPKRMKAGKYTILLSQGGEEVTGPEVLIAAKIPLVVKAAVVPVAGVIIWLLTRNPQDEFPEPPDLTGS